MADTKRSEIEKRQKELKAEFEELDKRRVEATQIAQKASSRQIEIAGALRELSKLLGEPVAEKPARSRK